MRKRFGLMVFGVWGCVAQPAEPVVTSEPTAELAFPEVAGSPMEVSLPLEAGRAAITGRALDDDRVVIEGDIVLSRKELARRATGVSSGRRWPGGVIYYATQGLDTRVSDAMAAWRRVAPVFFTQRTNQSNYVYFQIGSSGTGCYSTWIGMYFFGAQVVNLGPECSTGNAIHEIGHVLGLSHEQSRDDRNSYMTVHYDNIQDGQSSQFDMIDGAAQFDVADLDFGSVMMYGSFAFAKDTTKPTMTKLDGSTWNGQRVAPSDRDIGSVWSMYSSSGIHGKWLAFGAQGSVLGWPVTGERGTPDGIGAFVYFQGGAIYYSPGSGIHEIQGLILEKWGQLGWERSFLGYPLTDETTTPDGVGRYNHMQGGSIYWSPASGAHEVHGLIRDKWGQLGWERSFLGYPLTDETGTPDGIGRFNHFQGGSVYWSPNSGAHEVHGLIRDKWASVGWERSSLGYPTTDETGAPDGVGRFNFFQGGAIYWSPSTPAEPVQGAILNKWASLGYEAGSLGYPVQDELFWLWGVDSSSQKFQHATIHVRRSDGSTYLTVP